MLQNLSNLELLQGYNKDIKVQSKAWQSVWIKTSEKSPTRNNKNWDIPRIFTFLDISVLKMSARILHSGPFIFLLDHPRSSNFWKIREFLHSRPFQNCTFWTIKFFQNSWLSQEVKAFLIILLKTFRTIWDFLNSRAVKQIYILDHSRKFSSWTVPDFFDHSRIIMFCTIPEFLHTGSFQKLILWPLQILKILTIYDVNILDNSKKNLQDHSRLFTF